MKEDDTRMQETRKENFNMKDLGTKCREDAEKLEITV